MCFPAVQQHTGDLQTTANNLACCIYLVSKTPRAEQQLLQEVGNFTGKPGFDDLPSFPYTRAVINEALRLYPPGPQLSRTALQDVQVGSALACMMAIHAEYSAVHLTITVGKSRLGGPDELCCTYLLHGSHG